MSKISITKKDVFRAVKYTCFAASAGVVQVGTYALFVEVFHWYVWLGYFISLVLSVLWNFTFNRKFTFQSASSIPVAMFKVACYYVVFTPLSIGWTYLLCDFHGEIVHRWIVEVVTILINFITEYLYQQFYVFKDSLQKPASDQTTN